MAIQISPGFYCKLRLDDEGNITDVAELEASDLPKHSHSLEDIADYQSEVDKKVAEVLSTFFANNGNSAVRFTYDKKTRTVSADLNLDDETITTNEYGQLIATAASGATVVTPGAVNSKELDKLREDLKDLRENLPETLHKLLSQVFASSQNTAVDFIWDKETGTVSADVNIDGISISKDENGDLVATGAVVGSGEDGNCASHTHLSEQIEDFEEAVRNIFDDYSKNITIDLSKYIDGITIKINKDGQLSAVKSALEKHTHVLADIEDYEAADAAAKQMMSALGEDVDLSDGVIDFTSLNIGYSILALNKYLQDVVNKSIYNLSKKVNSLSIEKDNSGQAILSVHSYSVKNNLFDRTYNVTREVYLAEGLCLTLDFLPYEKGKIKLIKENDVVDVQEIEALNAQGRSAGRFSVERAYFKNSYFTKILKINIEDLVKDEGMFTFQVQFEIEDDTADDESSTRVDHSNAVQFHATPNKKLRYKVEDISDTHKIAGERYYDYPKQLKYKVTIENYSTYRFVNNASGFVDGELTGIADRSKPLRIEDLFGETQVDLNFVLREEHSSNPLIQHLTLKKGVIIDDILQTEIEDSLEPYEATFKIANSEAFNALKLTVADPRFKIENANLERGDVTAYGTLPAEALTPGFIKLSNTSYVLTFGNVYNSGKEEMQLVISTHLPLNLNSIQFTPIDLY